MAWSAFFGANLEGLLAGLLEDFELNATAHPCTWTAKTPPTDTQTNETKKEMCQQLIYTDLPLTTLSPLATN